MRTEYIRITYLLEFRSAFHFGTGLRDGLVHRAVARTPDGFLYVPGSTIKGTLRDRCEQIAQLSGLETTVPHSNDWSEVNRWVDVVTRIFGSRVHPAQLCFDDAQMIDEDRELFETEVRAQPLRDRFKAWQTEKRTRVSLDRATRTAQPGRLFNSEYGIQGLRFRGQIAGMVTGMRLPSLEEGSFPLLLLVAGLSSLETLGADKSTGAGRIRFEIDDGLVHVNRRPVVVEELLRQLEDLEQEMYALCREEEVGT